MWINAVLTELECVRLHSGGEEKFCVTNLGFGFSSFSTYIQNRRQNQRINVVAIHSYCIWHCINTVHQLFTQKGSDLHRLSLCCYGNFHCYAGGRQGLQASLMSGIRNWGIFFFDWLRVQMKHSCFRDTTVECIIFHCLLFPLSPNPLPLSFFYFHGNNKLFAKDKTDSQQSITSPKYHRQL